MISCNQILGSLLLAVSAGCSADAGEGYTPLGDGGSSAGISSAGISSAGISSAGVSAGTAASGGTNTGGVFAGTGGTGGTTTGGVVGQGGAAQGGATQGGAAQAGAAGSGVTPTDGKGLYELNCQACHGEQGVGTLLAPETQHPVRDYSNWVVRNGRAQTTFPKPMEKVGTDKLSDAQLTLIWNYLDLPPQPTTGKALFNDYCANCHGADGKGGPTTRNIVNEVQNVLKLVRSGKNVGNYAMRHDSMPAFTTMRISDPELTLIHDYVDSF